MSEESTRSPPAWMPKRSASENWALADADHDIAIAHAQYRKRFPLSGAGDTDGETGDDANLYLAVSATLYASCNNLTGWRQVADNYEVAALPENTAIKKSNAVVAARAIHLRAAITRLLALTGAPSAMIADANALLTPLCPKGAEQRAKSQKVILGNPDVGIRGAAKAAKTSAGQISNDRKEGTIAVPTDGVWSNPV